MSTPRSWWRPAPGIVRAALVGALASLCGVALTATSGWLIVQASTRPVILTLLTAIVGVRAFGIGRPVLRYAERILSHDAALADLVRRRVTAYHSLIPLTPVGLGRRRRGDLMAGIVHDLDDEVEVQVRALVPLLSAVICVAAAATVCRVLLPGAGLVVLASAAAALGTAAVCTVWAAHASRATQRARAQVHEQTQLLVTNLESLQAISAIGDVLTWIDDAHACMRRAIRRQSRAQAVGVGVVPWCVGAATVVMAFRLQDALRADLIGAPVAAMLLLVPVALSDVLTSVPEAGEAWLRGRVAHRRLSSVLEGGDVHDESRHAEGATTALSGPPEIELAGVSATWSGQRVDLPTTDLTIRPGEHLGVIGANGAGKSTLLAVLARHLEPTTGCYRLDGSDVHDRYPEDVRRLIAVVDDEPHVFAGTVRSNLLLAGPGADGERLRGALARAGLGDWLDGLTDGLETVLGLGGQAVSGGERVRLSIARALLSDRPILLLDEPVAHLDHATAQRVMRDLHTAARDSTVVVVSHQSVALPGCDRVVTIGDPATSTTVTTTRDTVMS